MNSPAPNRLPRAWYEAPIRGFLETPDDAILGALTRGSGDHTVEPAQTQAWLAQIALLKRWLAAGTEGSVYFEFNIPRMGRRIDAVLPPGLPVQGNLDPLALVAGGAPLDDAVRRIIKGAGERPHIFNLGHGIVPQTPIVHVERLVEHVRNADRS